VSAKTIIMQRHLVTIMSSLLNKELTEILWFLLQDVLVGQGRDRPLLLLPPVHGLFVLDDGANGCGHDLGSGQRIRAPQHHGWPVINSTDSHMRRLTLTQLLQ
jgi:hypothetical protein